MSSGLFGYHGARRAGPSMGDALARDASHNAMDARSRATFLEERVEKLSLVCMAMWSLIQDKTNVTEEDLLERVKRIDLMDGREDGKAARGIQRCPQCNRVMSPRHGKCIYCGAERLEKSAFDNI